MRLAATSSIGLLLMGTAMAQLAPPNTSGMTMGHLHLNVRSVEAEKKFFVEQFGATPLKRDGLPGVMLPGMVIFFRQQDPTGGTVGTALDHIGLKVRDLAGTLKRAQDAGFKTLPIFTGSEGLPNAYVTGPDDLKIELQSDPTLTTTSVGHHLHYYMKEPLPLRDWYLQTFNFEKAIRGRHQSANVPGMNLSFQPVPEQPTAATKGRTIDHIGFEVKNLEAFCKKLEASGIKLDVPYRKVANLGLSIAFLTDPAGVYIELTEGLDAY